MSIRHTALLLLILLVAMPSLASAAQPCKKLSKDSFIYAIGSSTMGNALGPKLKKKVEKAGFKFRKWAKASSGLARTDFHDWPSKVPEVIEQWSPDAFVISLGTNDYQAIYTAKGWIKPSERAKWDAVYGKRVDRMLELTSGKRRQRMVIWVGPTPFDTRKGRAMSVRIARIIKERIDAFDGPAYFVDMTKTLLASNNRPKKTFKPEGSKKTRPVYSRDGVHLTLRAVEHLMARPVVEILRKCSN